MKFKHVLIILVLGAVGYYIVWPICLAVPLFWRMKVAQEYGCKYMDSITAKDIPVWIERTKKYLQEYDPKSGVIGVYGTDKKPIPPELRKLEILRIDISSDYVEYVWLGGMDHTNLQVQKTTDGNFKFTANYNNHSSKVIWPKVDANQPHSTADKPRSQ